jgi:5-methylcytosine-specific restriction protein A
MDEMKAADKRYDDRRGSAAARGYDARWDKAREAYLNRNPLCEMCEKEGRTTPAVLVHHKKPIDEGGERLNPDNLMALCRECHEKIHGRKR